MDYVMLLLGGAILTVIIALICWWIFGNRDPTVIVENGEY
jgi:hypothetical protein